MIYLLLVKVAESMDAAQHCAHHVGLQQVASLAVKPSDVCICKCRDIFTLGCTLDLLVISRREKIPEPTHGKLGVVYELLYSCRVVLYLVISHLK